MHVFAESHHGNYTEVDAKIRLPEFDNLPTSCLSIASRTSNLNRITVCGCTNGYIRIARHCAEAKCEIIGEITLDGPISSVCLFPPRPTLPIGAMHPVAQHIQKSVVGRGPGSFTSRSTKEAPIPTRRIGDVVPLPMFMPADELLHLAAASALGYAIVFSNVLKEGFSKGQILPESDTHDSCTGVLAADIDWDGNNELLVTTFGQAMLVYNQCDITGSPNHVQFELHKTYRFARPVYSPWCSDVTGDGLDELIVPAMGGCHIMQANLKTAKEKVDAQLAALAELIQLEEEASAKKSSSGSS